MYNANVFKIFIIFLHAIDDSESRGRRYIQMVILPDTEQNEINKKKAKKKKIREMNE